MKTCMQELYRFRYCTNREAGNKLDMGDIVSLQAQTSPYFQLREKFKCIENIDKSETRLKLLTETRKSEQNISQFQILSLNPGEAGDID